MSLVSGLTCADEPQTPQETQPPSSEERAKTVEPKPAVPPPPGPMQFEAEPIRDISIIGIAVTFSGLLQLINSTGEVHPQQIARDFNPDSLLFFDRPAVNQTFQAHANLYSNLGLAAMVAYAIADPIATGYREGKVQSALVDFFIYGEALAVTWGLTNLAKISVRRPRPSAYKIAAEHADDPNFVISDTDASASFFSGHASICGAVTATATYLAFARSPDTARGWVTLAVGSALTVFVDYERVRSGAHFPSDVIAGTVAGAGIGVLITHMHRAEERKQRPLWIGYSPETRGSGGALTLSGAF